MFWRMAGLSTASPKIWANNFCLFDANLSRSSGNHRPVVTQVLPPDNQQMTDETFKMILATAENNPVSSREIYTVYVEKLCRGGELLDVARLLHHLRNKQLFLSAKTYNTLLRAAGEGNDFELLSQIFKDFLASCQTLSSISYFNLAKGLSKATDSVLLLDFIREVSELTFPRSATVINRIIYGFAEYKHIDKALLIFDQMKSLKFKPDVITYNTVLAMLGQAGRLDEMLHEFAAMKEAGMVPDIVSYNTLINSSRKVGRLDLCLMFLQEIVEKGLEPDLRTYTALIDSFGRLGNVEESLRLFTDMKRRSICPSIYVYRSLISNLKKAGKLELAINLSAEMNSRASDLVGPKDFKVKK
ncbi:PREDICTED: pentatricopeptide repeat-containing protein At1g11900 isoform X2 [Nelumbo nucifera]|uniref:Pentatricopeptide repeat-containing protein At1g11900 n=2 Tax=Nelumbo nucifera TaxID=4432 RepID=A0A822ZTZ9_NELNU|nr:PREDICTED: pentatricopeptide repeat-containing protein At1g11900 isoform X2 [Nelumbo nucifera]DAD46366.1 TPA_asm: hypothetical protein HUJ06_004596 [Nelumbo nucifera]